MIIDGSSIMRTFSSPLAILVTVLLLTGCFNQDNTSVSLLASDTTSGSIASDTDASTPDTSQTLTSTDNKISIAVPQGQFSDQLDHAADWVDKQEIDTLTLLQRDDSNGITLSVNNFGKPKEKAEVYFQQLTDTLKADTDLQNLKVGMATDNRMGYRFTHATDGITLAEECIALYKENNLSVICASSDAVDPQQLTDLLKNISVQN